MDPLSLVEYKGEVGMDPLSLVESTRGKYSAQSVTGHFLANLGICPVDFPLCPTK